LVSSDVATGKAVGTQCLTPGDCLMMARTNDGTKEREAGKTLGRAISWRVYASQDTVLRKMTYMQCFQDTVLTVITPMKCRQDTVLTVITYMKQLRDTVLTVTTYVKYLQDSVLKVYIIHYT